MVILGAYLGNLRVIFGYSWHSHCFRMVISGQYHGNLWIVSGCSQKSQSDLMVIFGVLSVMSGYSNASSGNLSYHPVN